MIGIHQSFCSSSSSNNNSSNSSSSSSCCCCRCCCDGDGSYEMIGIHKSFCVEDWPSLTARRVYSVVVFVIQFCLPLLATSCLYLRIYARLRSRRQARRRLDSSRRTNNSSVTGVRSPRTEIGKKCSESGSDRRSKRVGPGPARIRHLSPSLTRAFVPLCSENCRETCVGQIRKAQKTQPALESRPKCGSDRRSKCVRCLTLEPTQNSTLSASFAAYFICITNSADKTGG